MRSVNGTPRATGFRAALAVQITWAEATLRRELPPRQRVELQSALRYWRGWQRRQRRQRGRQEASGGT